MKPGRGFEPLSPPSEHGHAILLLHGRGHRMVYSPLGVCPLPWRHVRASEKGKSEKGTSPGSNNGQDGAGSLLLSEVYVCKS